MTELMPDRVEISIDVPEKLYMSAYAQESYLKVAADDLGIHIHNIDRLGDERGRMGLHIQFSTLVLLMAGLGNAPVAQGCPGERRRDELADATRSLAAKLSRAASDLTRRSCGGCSASRRAE